MTQLNLPAGSPRSTSACPCSRIPPKVKANPSDPKQGSSPRWKSAHSYRGELVFVDHANRRGSLRVQGAGQYFRNAPHPFAMLPYGVIRYHGAPADLRDIPLGAVLHVRAFLPPDPKLSACRCCRSTTGRETRATAAPASTPPRTTSSFLKTSPATAFAKDWSGS